MASYDALTGLPNRHYLNQRLNKAISEAAQQQQKVALMFLDLDRFKNVNDTAGHAAGDALLRSRPTLTLMRERATSAGAAGRR
jgi:diguanylate cyclase (GGDEF)-like protein